MLLPQKFSMAKTKYEFKSKNNLSLYTLFFILASIFVYLASFSTSPLYPFYYGGDSAQFQTIGRGWANGLIPYRDLFDHKGPIIFFVDMLGFSLTGSSKGIVIIQILSMFITIIALFKISQLITVKKLYGIVAVIMSLIVLTLVYGDGNLTEEYCLPFLSISTYFQLKYFYGYSATDDSKVEHRPILACIYGFTFGICFLTRITNGITVCSGVLTISILLIKKRKYLNLIQNAMYFVSGFGIITLPFIIYFAYYGVLNNFFYATILYNLEYQAHMSSWLLNCTGNDVIQYSILYFTSYSIFFTALLALFRRKNIFVLYCVICGILESYLFLSGALYSQYAIIMLPQFLMLLNEIVLLSNSDKSIASLKVIFLTIITIFCHIALGRFIAVPVDTHNTYDHLNEIGYERLLDIIPKNERTSFVAYGDNDLKTIYLLHDLLPYYKYFSIQEWHSSFSQYVKNDIHKIFEEGDVLWILVGNNADNIKDIIETKYSLIAEEGKYKLYHLQ